MLCYVVGGHTLTIMALVSANMSIKVTAWAQSFLEFSCSLWLACLLLSQCVASYKRQIICFHHWSIMYYNKTDYMLTKNVRNIAWNVSETILTQPISKFINNEITWSCPMSTHTKFCLFTLMVFFLQKIPPSFAGGICLLYSLLCVCSLLSSWVIPVSWFNDYRLSKEERMHFGSKEWKGGKRLVMGPGLPRFGLGPAGCLCFFGMHRA